MQSETYKNLKEEIDRRKGDNQYSKRQLLILQNQIHKDLQIKITSCPKCGRTDKLTLDHIVPQYILACFGIDSEHDLIEDNFTILCKPCNMFKSNRLDFSIPETKKILLRLLEKI